MAVIVGIVTPNGLLYGGIGATVAEATGSACDALGEDFEAFATLEIEYAHQRIDEAVAELEGGDPRPVAPGPAGAGVGGTTGDGGSGLEVHVHGSVASTIVGASGTPEAPAEAPQTPAGDPPRCIVCSVEVTPDRAEVSLEDYGVIQCRKHSPE